MGKVEDIIGKRYGKVASITVLNFILIYLHSSYISRLNNALKRPVVFVFAEEIWKKSFVGELKLSTSLKKKYSNDGEKIKTFLLVNPCTLD